MDGYGEDYVSGLYHGEANTDNGICINQRDRERPLRIIKRGLNKRIAAGICKSYREVRQSRFNVAKTGFHRVE